MNSVLLVPTDYPSVEEALNAAVAGDTIRIACGTYFEYDLPLKPGVRVEGEDQEEPCVVIDAQSLGRVFWVSGECGRDTEIVGLVLTHGYAAEGGAMYLDQGSAPTIKYCRFLDNSVSDVHGEGGAIRCVRASPMLTNVLFSGNSAAYGGAMDCHLESVPVLVDCEFIGNTATGLAHGGALHAYDSTLQVRNCLFSDNEGTDGGGVDCRVMDGGGRAIFERCTFTRNSGFHGGGFLGRNVDLVECEFCENESYIGGGAEGYYVYAESCVFRGNTADVGGAFGMADMSARDSRVESTLAGCTLYENAATHGGGAYVFRLHLNLVNTIIAGSTSGEAIDADGYETSASLHCCNLFGNAGGDWVSGVDDQLGVDGNVSMDPVFCNTDIDLSIGASSPCAPENSGGCGLIGAEGVGCE